jgi:hypothetical protein
MMVVVEGTLRVRLKQGNNFLYTNPLCHNSHSYSAFFFSFFHLLMTQLFIITHLDRICTREAAVAQCRLA